MHQILVSSTFGSHNKLNTKMFNYLNREQNRIFTCIHPLYNSSAYVTSISKKRSVYIYIVLLFLDDRYFYTFLDHL